MNFATDFKILRNLKIKFSLVPSLSELANTCIPLKKNDSSQGGFPRSRPQDKNSFLKKHFLYCCSITVVCIFSPPLHSTPAKPPSLPFSPSPPWYIYTMEFYAAERKKELLPFVTAWMELESIMLSEISQVVRDKYHMISLLTGT